jgi:uncharacterized membrane protein YfcA
MELIGYFAAVLVGITLGLVGGGGSILTVPILYYIFGIEPVTATAYSMFVVGTTAWVGSYSYFKKGLVNLRSAFVFGIPSVAAVFATRAWIVPAIPDLVFSVNNFQVTKSLLLMLVFALLMLAASYSMIRKERPSKYKSDGILISRPRYLLMFLNGLMVGSLTGLVGAGGGFLIIPALVIFNDLAIKEAVGTSLVIIGANSLLGFVGTWTQYHYDWALLLSVTGFAILGILIGTALAKKVDGAKLKPFFGWFVLVMGIVIILKELLF